MITKNTQFKPKKTSNFITKNTRFKPKKTSNFIYQYQLRKLITFHATSNQIKSNCNKGNQIKPQTSNCNKKLRKTEIELLVHQLNRTQGLKTMDLDPILLNKAGLNEEIRDLLTLITLQLDNLS